MVKNSENLEYLRKMSSLCNWGYTVNEKGTACVSLEGSTKYSIDGGGILLTHPTLTFGQFLKRA